MRIRSELRLYLNFLTLTTLAAIVLAQPLFVLGQGRIVSRSATLGTISQKGSEETKAADGETSETVCTDGHINFTTSGNSTSETWGNTRTYSGGGVNVKARAWSRTKDTGSWQTAYLGQYGSAGLGVTDRVEGSTDPAHKVDNNGLLNYILFAFDQPISVDMVQLESVTTDSDLTVWIGNASDPYTTPLTMSDALLAGLTNETNTTTLTTARDADINAGSVVGNVLVVAARVDQSNDYFKIANVDKDCAPPPPPPPPVINLIVIKEVLTVDLTNASTQSFSFTSTNTGQPTFSLVDNNSVLNDRKELSVTAGATATVVENQALGWSLSDLACTGTAQANISYNFAVATVSVTPQANELVTCTFTNAQIRPSAASVSLSGRATLMDSRGVSGAIVTLQNLSTGERRTVTTNTLGYYSISDVEVGQFYMVSITHRRYRFAENSRFFTVQDNLEGVDFVGGF